MRIRSESQACSEGSFRFARRSIQAIVPKLCLLFLATVVSFLGARAYAASVCATVGVSAIVIENCAALLNSSTTVITASYACRADPVATVLSPMVSSTSLSIMVPAALFGQPTAATRQTAGATTQASSKAASASGTAETPLNSSISVGPTTSQFISSTGNNDDQIVMITY